MSRYFIYQRGAGTLLFSIVVLLLVTFTTLYTSKSIITETKISNNELRAKQAFEAAETGINKVLSLLKAKQRPCIDGGVFADDQEALDNTNFYVIFEDSLLAIEESSAASQTGQKGFVRVTIDASSCLNNILSDPFLEITAVGMSDDRAATRTIVVNADQADAIRNVPENPMTGRGVVGLTGNVRVYNQEGATSVWSGSGVNVNAASKNYTYVASPADPDYPDCMYTSATCEVVSVTADGTGVDIISNDTTLTNLSKDEFFENFFGMTIAEYKASGAVTEMEYDATVVADNFLGTNMFINVDSGESFKIPAGTSLGCSNSSALGTGMDPYFTDGKTHCEKYAGAYLDPTIIVVDGDLNLPANAHIYGLVVVLGDVISGGNPEITGALISYGSVGENGAVIVRYNSSVINQTSDNADFYVSPGGWRDF